MTTVKPMSFLTNYGDVMCAMKTRTTDECDDSQPAIDAILAHIARYRLSTFAALSRMPQFADESPRHLRRLLRDCREAELLSSAALHLGSRYWFLTPAGATRCGLDESRSGPLSETAKLRAYALLLFCCTSDKPRHRLTASELSQQFSALHRLGMPGTYYFDTTGKGSIGLARIDAGHQGRWDRVVESVRDDISLHKKLPGFQQLIKAHRFEITVLTVLPAKAERTVNVLKSLPEVKQVPVHVVAQPELLPLICSSPGKEENRNEKNIKKLPHHGFYRSRPRSKEKQRAGNLSHRRQN
jgi:hypothetical protein